MSSTISPIPKPQHSREKPFCRIWTPWNFYYEKLHHVEDDSNNFRRHYIHLEINENSVVNEQFSTHDSLTKVIIPSLGWN